MGERSLPAASGSSDCHIHMVLDGVDWKKALARHEKSVDREWVRSVLAQYRDKGYTYLRDGGDRWGAGAFARKCAPDYGICYRTPLAPLAMVGHYGGFIGQCFGDMKEFAQLVVDHRRQGADFIKIMVSGLMDFDRFGVLSQPGLDPACIREMVHIAHEEGFSVMVHANGARTIEAAAAAGVDSVEHGAYPDTDALWAMAQQGVVWVPTLSTVANLRGKGRFDQLAVERILDCAMENVAAFARMGGLVAPGSDAGAWAVPHGCGTEEKLLAECGVDCRSGAARIREKF